MATTWLAGIVVVACGIWLIGLAASIVIAPARTAAFLKLFASSARAHYIEQVLRLIAGRGLVVFADEMQFPAVFRLFGWVVLATTAGLLLMPWWWHHRFAAWATPLALRHFTLFALGAFALGTFILVSMV